MNIYRIENKDGIGPYHGSPSIIDPGLSEKIRSPHPRPSPMDDMLLSNKIKSNPTWVFGFSSLRQILDYWFTSQEVRIILRHGYKIVRYNAIDYYETDSQVIFNKRSAIKI